MLIFRYDKTFEGLLTAIFDAYSIKRFPDVLLAEEETPPLFYDEIITVITDEGRSNRETYLFLRRPLSQHVIHLFSLGELVSDTETQTGVILRAQQLVNTLQTVMPPVTSLTSQTDRPER